MDPELGVNARVGLVAADTAASKGVVTKSVVQNVLAQRAVRGRVDESERRVWLIHRIHDRGDMLQALR